MLEIFILAVGSMVWPALLAIDVVAFKTDRPVTILGGFLAGGLLTTVAIGCLIVFALEQTSLVTGSRHTFDPVVSIIAGMTALAYAAVLHRRRDERTTRKQPGAPGRIDRLAEHGAALAFVTGIVLNVFPGVLPFIGMKNIGELNYSAAGTVAVIIGFYLVMFTPVELPLVAFLVAPAQTAPKVDAFNVWLDANLRRLASWVLTAFGIFELVRGLAAL